MNIDNVKDIVLSICNGLNCDSVVTDDELGFTIKLTKLNGDELCQEGRRKHYSFFGRYSNMTKAELGGNLYGSIKNLIDSIAIYKTVT